MKTAAISPRLSLVQDDYPACVDHVRLQADEAFPPHPRWKIVLVTAGHAIHCVGKTAHAIRAGDAFVVPGGKRESYEDVRDLRVTTVLFDYRSLKIDKWPIRGLSGFQALFRPKAGAGAQVDTARLHLDDVHLRNSIALAQELDKCRQDKFPCWQMLADIHFRHLVLLLSHIYEGYFRRHDESGERMADCIAYLECNFQEEIDLRQLASRSNMSQRTFYRLFRLATRHAPLAYLIRLRIRHGCELLRNTDWPVTKIAFDVGFNGSNYFAREFRKIVGETPSAYRDRWAD